MHQTYRVMQPEVVADIIDGEAVIMNLKTGQYFSCEDTGGECWDALAAGYSVAQVVDQLASEYTADREAIESAVEEFVADLVSHMLIAPSNALPPLFVAKAPPPSRAPFHPPVLNVYSDMQDLLTLDPIHDVDAAGWPMPKNETAI
jgi:hypothetical protein